MANMPVCVSPILRPSPLPPLTAEPGPAAATVQLPTYDYTPDSDPTYSPWRQYKKSKLDVRGLRTLKALSRKVHTVCKRPAGCWVPPPPLDISKLKSPLRQLVTLPREESAEIFTIYTRTRSRAGIVKAKRT